MLPNTGHPGGPGGLFLLLGFLGLNRVRRRRRKAADRNMVKGLIEVKLNSIFGFEKKRCIPKR